MVCGTYQLYGGSGIGKRRGEASVGGEGGRFGGCGARLCLRAAKEGQESLSVVVRALQGKLSVSGCCCVGFVALLHCRVAASHVPCRFF